MGLVNSNVKSCATAIVGVVASGRNDTSDPDKIYARRYTRFAVPLKSLALSSAERSAAKLLKAFHSTG
jgi:hypothetical protein